MIDLAWEEAGRMNRFISNLLDITRLEAGALKIKKEPYDVQDLVGFLPRFPGTSLQRKNVRINLPRASLSFPWIRPPGPGFE